MNLEIAILVLCALAILWFLYKIIKVVIRVVLYLIAIGLVGAAVYYFLFLP
jgi:hypothetical protein